MGPIPKTLISIGVILILIGLLWQIGGRFFPLGKLPGDIIIKKDNYTFYFPIITSILLSVILSVILYLLRLFR